MSDGHSWTSGHQFWVGQSTRSSTSIPYPFSQHEARLESSSLPWPEPSVSPGVSLRARPLLITMERRGAQGSLAAISSFHFPTAARTDDHRAPVYSRTALWLRSPNGESLMRLKSRGWQGCPLWRLQDNGYVLASSASGSRLHSSALGPSPHLELHLSTLCLHRIFSLAPALRPPS